MGWSLGQFFALPDAEQIFWRAHDLRRQRQLDELLTTLRDVKTFDRLAATMLVLLERG